MYIFSLKFKIKCLSPSELFTFYNSILSLGPFLFLHRNGEVMRDDKLEKQIFQKLYSFITDG